MPRRGHPILLYRTGEQLWESSLTFVACPHVTLGRPCHIQGIHQELSPTRPVLTDEWRCWAIPDDWERSLLPPTYSHTRNLCRLLVLVFPSRHSSSPYLFFLRSNHPLRGCPSWVTYPLLSSLITLHYFLSTIPNTYLITTPCTLPVDVCTLFNKDLYHFHVTFL